MCVFHHKTSTVEAMTSHLCKLTLDICYVDVDLSFVNTAVLSKHNIYTSTNSPTHSYSEERDRTFFVETSKNFKI